MKRFFLALVLMLFITGLLTAAAPLPNTTITLVHGLPSTMNVGEVNTVVVEVTSDQDFLQVQALPSFAYPGKGVVAVQGGDRAGRGTSGRRGRTCSCGGGSPLSGRLCCRTGLHVRSKSPLNFVKN